MTDIAPIAIGFAAGLLVGATSTGGGALLTPALILIAGVPPSIAIGSDVLIASVMKLFGGGFYALRREVHWPTVGRLAAGSIPGAGLGMAVLDRRSRRKPRDGADPGASGSCSWPRAPRFCCA